MVLALLLGASSVRADEALSEPPGSTAVAVSTFQVVGSTVPADPFVSPLGKHAKILSGFGPRHVPNSEKTEAHDGVDYRCAPGTPVHTSRSGIVLFAGFSTAYVNRNDKTDKSRFMIIEHADRMSSRYVHLNTLKVAPRQSVKPGQIIGTCAESTEWSEPVLHFEIRAANGKPLDPEDVIETPIAK